MKISYECSDLIEELKEDIAEVGNFKLWAISSMKLGKRIYTDYDFIIPNMTQEDKEKSPAIQLKIGQMKEEMLANKLLAILEEQNSIF